MSQRLLSPFVSSLNNQEEDFLGAGRDLACFTLFSQSKRATKLHYSPKQPLGGGFPGIIGTDWVLAVAMGFVGDQKGLSQKGSYAVIEAPVVSSPPVLSPLPERLETKSVNAPGVAAPDFHVFTRNSRSFHEPREEELLL